MANSGLTAQKLFTKLPLNEIKKLSKLKNKEINEAKKILGYEVTKLCRGKISADRAKKMTNNLFDNKILDQRFRSHLINHDSVITDKFNIIDALESLDLVKSRSDAKRIIKSGGVKVNDSTFTNGKYSLSKYIDNKEIKISVGKNKIGIIKIKL